MPIMLILLIILCLILFISVHNRKHLERIAYVDSLTGVATLTRFKLDAQAALKAARPMEYVLISLDMDDFKYINDSFGYEVGNKILVAITEHFVAHLRPHELVCRVNADNFVFLTRNISDIEFEKRTQMISDAHDRLQNILPEHYNITFSVGIYRIDDPNEDFSLMLDKANFARKSIKGNHSQLIAEYTDEMDSQMEWKKKVTLSMERALIHHEFEVYLQPKYLLQGECMVGAEALIRWNHPQNGLLSPSMFIPIFEQNGFITKLDNYVFEQVCSLLKKWKDAGRDMEDLTVSVNLSRLHLFNPNLVEEMLAVTNRYGVAPSRIEIELTESIVFHNTRLLVTIMNQLRQAGFHISIDDFGSGYSSLNLLKDLPVDILKIDKGFLTESSDVSNGRVIIDAVTKMAKSLYLITVAEGVETKEQVKMLQGMGCDIAQGYYYARPMPISSFEKLM